LSEVALGKPGGMPYELPGDVIPAVHDPQNDDAGGAKVVQR
jgi:hypothetical protein